MTDRIEKRITLKAPIIGSSASGSASKSNTRSPQANVVDKSGGILKGKQGPRMHTDTRG